MAGRLICNNPDYVITLPDVNKDFYWLKKYRTIFVKQSISLLNILIGLQKSYDIFKPIKLIRMNFSNVLINLKNKNKPQRKRKSQNQKKNKMEKARFQLLSEDELAILAEECNNKNTKRSTNTWLNVYKSWAVERNMKVQLEDYSPLELDVVLCQFYGEIRKKDGNNYESDSLRVMQAVLHRYLVEKKYPKSIMDDIVFDKSIKTLEGKARLLRQSGMGKRPNASQAITRDEEDELWRCGKLGMSNPVSLLHTIWYLNIQHFGQRGQQEHASVTIENFQRKTNESFLVYIEYFEPPNKTRQHGLHPNLRITNPKMFEIPGNEKCPVKIFDFYVSKRPSVLQKTGRFYLSPKSVFSNDVDEPWFKSVPIGKNKIATFMKEISQGQPSRKPIRKSRITVGERLW